MLGARVLKTVPDVIPVHTIGLTLNLPHKVTGVRLVPEGEALRFEQGDALTFVLPRLEGHQMVELSY